MAIVISDINEGPAVNVAAWFGTIVMVLGVCSRLWSKYSVLRKWTIDDALIIVTMVSVPLDIDELARIMLIIPMKVFGLYNDRYHYDDGFKRSRGTPIISE
jgi:hypothetical protein